MDIEALKQRYPKVWAEYQTLDPSVAEKLFIKHIRALERVEKAKRKLLTASEREKKREARALIILSKLLIAHHPEIVRQILSQYTADFQAKEGAVLIDYAKYITRLLEPSKTETSSETSE